MACKSLHTEISMYSFLTQSCKRLRQHREMLAFFLLFFRQARSCQLKQPECVSSSLSLSFTFLRTKIVRSRVKIKVITRNHPRPQKIASQSRYRSCFTMPHAAATTACTMVKRKSKSHLAIQYTYVLASKHRKIPQKHTQRSHRPPKQ